MIAAKAYQLWYVGAAQHELLYDTKQSMAVQLLDGSKTIMGKQMGERLMENLEFDGRQLDRYQARNYQASKAHSREIDRVHKACSEEIRGTWDVPQIGEQDLQDVLFADAVGPELDKIPDAVKLELFAK